MRRNVFDKTVITSFIEKSFQNEKISEALKSSSTNCFGTVIWKKSKKSCYSILFKNIFRTESFLKQRRVALRNLLVLWVKKFKKILIPHPISKHFQNQKFFGKQRRALYESYQYCEIKKSSTKLWYPILLKTIFRTTRFLKQRKVALRKVPALWDKKKFHKVVIRHLIEKGFQNQKFLQTKECFSAKRFSTLRQKVFVKIVILSLLEKNFENRKFSETKERYPHRIVSALWEKKYLTQNPDTPVFSIKFIDNRNFLKQTRVSRRIYRHCETKSFRQKCDSFSSWKKLSEPKILPNKDGFLYEFIGNVRQKVFDRVVIASRIEKVYQNQKSSETQKGCSTKSFGTVRRKVFDKVAVVSLPERKFGTRKFLKHWNVPLRNVSALWVKKIKKKRDTPSYWKRYPEPEVFSNIEVFLCEKIQYSETKSFRQNRDSFSSWRKLSEPENFETKEVSSTKCFGTVTQKSRQNPDTPTYWKSFSEPEVCWTKERYLYELFRYCGTKNTQCKIVIPRFLSIKFFDNRNFLK